MELLLTGATGFVGRSLLLDALKGGRYKKIHAVVRNKAKLVAQLQEEGFETLPPELSVLTASAPLWGNVPFPQVEHAVHAAAVLFARDQKGFDLANVEGTRGLFQKLGPTTKSVVLSSMSAAGPCPAGKLSLAETDPSEPVGAYGRSKLAMETMLRMEFPDRRIQILRPPLVLGARELSLLPVFKIAALPVRLKPGWRQRTYSYICIEDLISAIWAALDRSDRWELSRPRFVAAPEPVTDRDLMTAAGTRSGLNLAVPSPIVMGVAMLADAWPFLGRLLASLTVDKAEEMKHLRWVVSSQEFETQFQWKAQGNYRHAMQAMRKWYLDRRLL